MTTGLAEGSPAARRGGVGAGVGEGQDRMRAYVRVRVCVFAFLQAGSVCMQTSAYVNFRAGSIKVVAAYAHQTLASMLC